jgi:hypothetical protein
MVKRNKPSYHTSALSGHELVEERVVNRTNRVRLLVLIGLMVIAGVAAVVSTRQNGENQGAPPSESHDPTLAAQLMAMRDPDVPELPFPDNPDPSQCGIPSQWAGDAPAWLNGYYGGKLVEPIVYLYDSHSRLHIVAQAPHGTEVKVILYQNNPVVNYYMVKVVGLEGANEGWVPAPFLSFDLVEPLGSSGIDNAMSGHS